MRLVKYLSEKANIKAENRLLRLTVVVIGGAVLFNTFMIVKALDYQKIVLVPFGLESRAVISSVSLDEAYVSAFTRNIASLAFSYTPGTARKQFDELLLYYDPEAFPEGKKTFYNLADKITDTRASAAFFITKITIDQERKRIELIGVRRQFVDDRKIEDAQKTYWIDYKINVGKIAIMQISEAYQERAAGKEERK